MISSSLSESFLIIKSLINNYLGDAFLIRYWGLFFAPFEISYNEIFSGIGYSASEQITFRGLTSHTLFVKIFLSYGLIGLILFCLSYISLFFVDQDVLPFKVISGLILSIGIMLFEMNIHLFYALIPALCFNKITSNK